MDTEALSNLITTVGFPIAVCIFLLYERNKHTLKLMEIIQTNTEATKELKVMIESKF